MTAFCMSSLNSDTQWIFLHGFGMRRATSSVQLRDVAGAARCQRAAARGIGQKGCGCAMGRVFIPCTAHGRQGFRACCALCRAGPANVPFATAGPASVCARPRQRLVQPRPRCHSCALAVPEGVRQCGRVPSPATLPAAWQLDAPTPKRMCWPRSNSKAILAGHGPWPPCCAAPLGGAQLEAVDVVLPIPLATPRLRERGFNQALELVCSGGCCAHTCCVCPATPSKSRLARRERLHNLSQALAGAAPCRQRGRPACGAGG